MSFLVEITFLFVETNYASEETRRTCSFASALPVATITRILNAYQNSNKSARYNLVNTEFHYSFRYPPHQVFTS